MPDDEQRLKAQDLIREIKLADIHFIVALPDRTTSEHLLKPLLKDPDFRVVQVCKEDEGVSICSGLYSAGHRALLLMQYTGLLDSINAIRSRSEIGKHKLTNLTARSNDTAGKHLTPPSPKQLSTLRAP